MTKQMIQDVGNVELFELFETDPKTQCTECLSYWSEGIVYCTCGHLLKETVANRGFIEYSLDSFSIPEYVIKKGRPHGHTPEKKDYHLAHNLKKETHQKRIHRDPWSFLARSCFSLTFARTWSRWRCLSELERSCRTRFHLSNVRNRILSSPTKFVELSQQVWRHWRAIEKPFWLQPSVVYIKRLHRESGGRQLRPMPNWKYQQRQSSSSSSSTWWQWSGSWWSS